MMLALLPVGWRAAGPASPAGGRNYLLNSFPGSIPWNWKKLWQGCKAYHRAGKCDSDPDLCHCEIRTYVTRCEGKINELICNILILMQIFICTHHILCLIIIIHDKRHPFVTRTTSKHEMVWCWYQKMSVSTFGSFIKLMKLQCTASWVSLRDRA